MQRKAFKPPLRKYLHSLLFLLATVPSAKAHDTRTASVADIRATFLQTIFVHGKITDGSSRPVANAAVLIAGSERSTVTNLSGYFEIADAPLNGTLVIKHPDFETRQVPIVKSVSEYTIILKSRPHAAVSVAKSSAKPAKNQNEQNSSGDGNSAYTRVDRWPHFPGGYRGLNKFLANNLKYPEEALEAGVEGQVQVSFLLDEDGNVSSGYVISSPGAELEDEALRLVAIMPKWVPAQKDGRAITVWYTISIRFDPEVEKLPLRIREEIPKLFSKKMKLEPVKAPLPVKDELKKLFNYPAVDLSVHEPPRTRFQGYGFGSVRRPVFVPLKLNLRPKP